MAIHHSPVDTMVTSADSRATASTPSNANDKYLIVREKEVYSSVEIASRVDGDIGKVLSQRATITLSVKIVWPYRSCNRKDPQVNHNASCLIRFESLFFKRKINIFCTLSLSLSISYNSNDELMVYLFLNYYL